MRWVISDTRPCIPVPGVTSIGVLPGWKANALPANAGLAARYTPYSSNLNYSLGLYCSSKAGLMTLTLGLAVGQPGLIRECISLTTNNLGCLNGHASLATSIYCSQRIDVKVITKFGLKRSYLR